MNRQYMKAFFSIFILAASCMMINEIPAAATRIAGLTGQQAECFNTYKNVLYEKTAGYITDGETEDGVDTKTGNLNLQRTDISLLGINGFDFELNRYYSANEASGAYPWIAQDYFNMQYPLFGSALNGYGPRREDRTILLNKRRDSAYRIAEGWTFDFPWVESINGDASYLHLGSGGTVKIDFTNPSGLDYKYEDAVFEKLESQKIIDNKPCNYVLKEKDGTKSYFNSDGVIVVKKDVHDNKIIFDYKDKIYFDSIRDSAGRRIRFIYASSGPRLLREVRVRGGKKGIISISTRYGISCKYDKDLGAGYRILSYAVSDGEKEAYLYELKQTGIQTKTALLKSVTKGDNKIHYVYRSGLRSGSSLSAGQLRADAVRFYYVVMQFEEDLSEGKGAGSAKKSKGSTYHYFQLAMPGDGSSTTDIATYGSKNGIKQYGQAGTMNVTVISEFDPNRSLKYKEYVTSLFDKEGYFRDPGGIRGKTRLVKYDMDGQCTEQWEYGPGGSRVRYVYQYDNKDKTLVKTTCRVNMLNDLEEGAVTTEQIKNDKYGNEIERTSEEAYYTENTGREYLYRTATSYYDIIQSDKDGQPIYLKNIVNEVINYNKNNIRQTKVNMLSSNHIDIKSVQTNISTRLKPVSYISYVYNRYGNVTEEREYTDTRTYANGYLNKNAGLYLQKAYRYGDRRNGVFCTAEQAKGSVSRKGPSKTARYDYFGNVLFETDESGSVFTYAYSQTPGKEADDPNAQRCIRKTSYKGNWEETFEKEFTTMDDKKNMKIDQDGLCIVQIQDAFGNTVIEKNDKQGVWTEYTYNEKNLLTGEKVYRLVQKGTKTRKTNGTETANFDYGKPSVLLSSSKTFYDKWGEISGRAEFQYNYKKRSHRPVCTLWNLFRTVKEKRGNEIRTLTETKVMNPADYNRVPSKKRFFFTDTDCLSRTVNTRISTERGKITESRTYTQRGENGGQYSAESADRVYEAGVPVDVITVTLGRPRGNTLTIETRSYYDDAGNCIRETEKRKDSSLDQENTKIREYAYNNGRLKVQVKDSNGYATRYFYDEFGRTVKAVKEAGGKQSITKVRYDDRDQVKKVENLIEGDEKNGKYSRTEYGYDKRGNLVLVKNMQENTAAQYTQYLYDLRGNKIRMYTGLGSRLNIKLVKPPKAGVNNPGERVHVGGREKNTCSITKYEYNKKGQLTAYTDPEGREERYRYDSAGLLTSTTDKNGNILSNRYDIRGRLKNTFARDKSTGKQIRYDYSYTRYGEIRKSGDILYSYDKYGRLEKETEMPPGKTIIEKTYEYDLNGNNTRFTVKVGTEIPVDLYYEYDVFDRIKRVKENGGDLASYEYDLNDNVKKQTIFPAGIITAYTYDEANRVTAIDNSTAARGSLSRFHYTYYQNDNLKQAAEMKCSGFSGTGSYEYDSLGRLKKETYTGRPDIQYEYRDKKDSNNRTEMSAGSEKIKYTYNKNGELLSEDSNMDGMKVYRYDYNGNQLLAGDTVSRYNGLDQLTESISKGHKVQYEYYNNGLRSKKIVNGKEIKYVWNGDQLVLELDGRHNITRKYIRGLDLIYASDKDGNNRQYYLYNRRGDVVQLVDSAGNVSKTYEYDSFGNEAGTQADDNNPFRYNGQYYDKEKKNFYLRARYYDPASGRFTSRDIYTGESSEPRSLNRYTYCYNDGVNYTDPSGHKAASLEKEYNLPRPKSTDALRITISKNKVKVRWRTVFKGSNIENTAFNTGRTYHNIIKTAIKDKWSGAYTVKGHKVSVETDVIDSWFFGQINDESLPAYNYGEIWFYKKRGVSNAVWRGKAASGVIRMYTGDNRTGHNYTYDEFRLTASHEFGHILGIGDGYYDTATQRINSIMCDVWGDGNNISRQDRKATGKDIKKTLDAYKTDTWQNW